MKLSDTEFRHLQESEFIKEVKAKALDKILAQKVVYEKTLGVTRRGLG